MNLCECGCGQPTNTITMTNSALGLVKGEPRRFASGHNNRRSPVEYVVDPATGCWVWQKARIRGYGNLWSAGKSFLAHRVYYERFKGPIPPGLVIDHLCCNRACVNPDHLEPVTNTENVRRGKATRLTEGDVAAIRESLESRSEIALRYGITVNHITAIRANRKWKDAA